MPYTYTCSEQGMCISFFVYQYETEAHRDRYCTLYSPGNPFKVLKESKMHLKQSTGHVHCMQQIQYSPYYVLWQHPLLFKAHFNVSARHIKHILYTL